jgi:centrosomal CEP192-like protein
MPASANTMSSKVSGRALPPIFRLVAGCAIAFAASGGCGDQPPEAADSGPDARTVEIDANSDASDAASDAAPDAASDAAPDAATDAAPSGLVLDPSSIDFGFIEVGLMATVPVTLTNSSAVPADLLSISFSDDAFSLVSSTCTSMLEPGTSCQLELGLTPFALGPVAGQLQIDSELDVGAPLSGHCLGRISVAIGDDGGGIVVSSPSGIHCGSECTALYDGEVLLEAESDPGWDFYEWSDPLCGFSETCLVTAAATPTSITAFFIFSGDF